MVQGVQLQGTDTHALKDTAEALSAEPQSFVFIVSQHCIINGQVRRNITLNTDKRLRNCKTLAPESNHTWPGHVKRFYVRISRIWSHSGRLHTEAAGVSVRAGRLRWISDQM